MSAIPVITTDQLVSDREASRAYGRVHNAYGQPVGGKYPDAFRFVEFRADVRTIIHRCVSRGERTPAEIGRAFIEHGLYPVREYFAGGSTLADKCRGRQTVRG